jgi:hypothetical protein
MGLFLQDESLWLFTILAYYPYLKKLKEAYDLHAVYVPVHPPILTFECLNQSL